VLGEAAGQVSEDIKAQFPDITWQQPQRLRNRIVHGYWSIDWPSRTPPPAHNCPRSLPVCAKYSALSATAPEPARPASPRQLAAAKPADDNISMPVTGSTRTGSASRKVNGLQTAIAA
jgi:Ribonuclease HepT-like